MELFQLTLFFMLSFFLVVAFQVSRNRLSTTRIKFGWKEYWLLCSHIPPCQSLQLIAYLEKPGFTFGPYIWVRIETNEEGEVISLVEELEEF